MNVVEDEVRKMKKIVEGRIIENKKLFTQEEINTIFLNKNLTIKSFLSLPNHYQKSLPKKEDGVFLRPL